MTMYVNISPGTAPSVAAIQNQRKVLIIGKAGNLEGVFDNVTDASTLITAGMAITDPAYIAANAFLNDVGGAAISSVIIYCVPDSASEQTDEEYDGTKNGSNQTFHNQYSPLLGTGSNREFYLKQTGIMGAGGQYLTGIWYTVTSGWEEEVVNSIYTGRMTINSISGLTISGVTGMASGVFVLTSYDRLRADVTPIPISMAYKELSNPLYGFQFMMFAYDPSKETGPTPLSNSGYKYYSGNCYGGKSWLNDLFLGRTLVDQFVANQKPCMFAYSLPERVKPGDKITGLYASGTAYDTNTYKFEDLNTMISDQYVFLGSTKQLADSSSIDPAIDLVSIRMQNYRPTTTFGKSLLSQTEFPDGMESRRAMNALINPFVYIPVSYGTMSDGIRWGSNLTLGIGREGKINYVQCRNYTYKLVMDAIYAYLFTRPPYTYKGVQGLRAVIESVGQQVYANGIIDSIFTVIIPIEPFLQNENKLGDSDKNTLAQARASSLVDRISISYLFAGDIEYINVTALFGTY